MRLACFKTKDKAMQKGIVKHWNQLRGFGFIACDNGEPDVFVHISALTGSGPNTVRRPAGFIRHRDRRPHGQGEGCECAAAMNRAVLQASSETNACLIGAPGTQFLWRSPAALRVASSTSRIADGFAIRPTGGSAIRLKHRRRRRLRRNEGRWRHR